MVTQLDHEDVTSMRTNLSNHVHQKGQQKGVTMVTQLDHEDVTSTRANHSNQVRLYTFDVLPLQRGGQFGPITVAYETWGKLNVEGDNAVMITHALTGSSHAHDTGSPDDTKVAWWNPLIGPGRFFDTSR